MATDQLEPYRQMVRSICFVPPLPHSQDTYRKLTEPAPPSNPLPFLSISPSPSPAPASVNDGLPSDPTERATELIRAAVSQPSVLPSSYSIQENIGDRISRLPQSRPTSYTPPPTPYTPSPTPQFSEPTPTWTPIIHSDSLPADSAVEKESLAEPPLEPALTEPRLAEESLVASDFTASDVGSEEQNPVAEVHPEAEQSEADKSNADQNADQIVVEPKNQESETRAISLDESKDESDHLSGDEESTSKSPASEAFPISEDDRDTDHEREGLFGAIANYFETIADALGKLTQRKPSDEES